MTPKILSPVAAREAVPVLILQELAKVHGGDAVVLKGGVNLRLFFGSVRYSEDMDLDGDPECADAIRSCIEGTVLEFLDHAARGRYGTEDAWGDFQIQAAALVEAVLARQGET